MKRYLKRFGIGILLVLLLCTVFVAIEHFRGRFALERRLRELNSRGENLSVASLEPEHPRADQNACLALLALTNSFPIVMTNLDSLPPQMRFVEPGSAIVGWRLRQWNIQGQTNNWNAIAVQVQSAQVLLSQIRAAVGKEKYDSGFDYSKGFFDFHITPLETIRRAEQILDAATLYDFSRQNTDEAKQNLVALVKLAANQKPEPLVISQLVRLACASIAFNTTWAALQSPNWNDHQLADLQSAWADFNLPMDMISALQMERAMDLDYFRQIEISKGNSEFPRQGCFFFLWHIAWADQDELRCLNRWQSIIEGLRIVASSKSWSAMPGRYTAGPETDIKAGFAGAENRASWYDKMRFPISTGLFGISDKMFRRVFCCQADQQMVLTAIALRRYQLQTGTLASDLHVLVPKYLKSLPIDYMDGGTLRYKLKPQPNTYVLYSVGEDGVDNGGDPTIRTGIQIYHDIWDGKDAVWPRPVAQDIAEVVAIRPSK